VFILFQNAPADGSRRLVVDLLSIYCQFVIGVEFLAVFGTQTVFSW